MFPVFLLATAVGITAVVLILLLWRYLDRRVKETYPDTSPGELEKKLEEALQQHALPTARVEHLEAIVTSQMWDALHEDQPAPRSPYPPSPPSCRMRKKWPAWRKGDDGLRGYFGFALPHR